jgi:ectoine hydroxylase-related dioxygenase (phytanoyl-CoA dioxygenase family)
MEDCMASSADTPIVLNDTQRVQYGRDGFVIVRGLLEAREIDELREEAGRLMQRKDLIDSDNIRCRWQNHVDTGECRFDCFDPVIDLSPSFERLARDPRILSAVSQLYGEAACLFKDKLIFKPPGARGYGLHQDYISWPSFPESFVTVIAAIDPAGANNGATEMFPGYHSLGTLSPRDGMYHELTADQVDLSRGVILELEPGDVAIFSGFTPHRSGPNRSSEWRRLAYLSYNASSDGGEQREKHYAEFAEWLMERYAEYGKTNVFFR